MPKYSPVFEADGTEFLLAYSDMLTEDLLTAQTAGMDTEDAFGVVHGFRFTSRCIDISQCKAIRGVLNEKLEVLLISGPLFEKMARKKDED